ncbi:hypothetical protein K450DRAFT_230407 [Umbelopsis ramanniana AG]|uniref:Uncharacterized protein n=1 Tax=Umbelopsis ramanniana AG TaxID=1314678 RepID=A0AAD5HF36_UMBRA|nr:uncharacterized protein K450DRAFT_230407 [Umbelopsis ramanniana AG]KAI8582015.1 hypothetical protein K450DRAFT_230407 [Umbelopsis ramanniana AG]
MAVQTYDPPSINFLFFFFPPLLPLGIVWLSKALFPLSIPFSFSIHSVSVDFLSITN